jgi:DNA polymerase-2
MQLDRVGASIASFDLLYLPELRRRGIVAPSVDRSPSDERRSATVQGGALLDPQPGIFANVAVFDFKSLYPSLIRTFHLDPLAHARAGEGDIEAPNGARFSRGDAILPEVIERFMERREVAKGRGDRHADQAIKIMMNALFGVLGAASCRFFDPAIANAITGFGQRILHWSRDAFEQQGVRVLYGDTDSVFVQLTGPARGAEAEAEARSSTSSSASSCPRCAAARGAARNATRAGPGASSSSWASSRCAATGPPWPAASSAACWSASSPTRRSCPS